MQIQVEATFLLQDQEVNVRPVLYNSKQINGMNYAGACHRVSLSGPLMDIGIGVVLRDYFAKFPPQKQG